MDFEQPQKGENTEGDENYRRFMEGLGGKSGDAPNDSSYESRVTLSEEEIERIMNDKNMTREEVMAMVKRASEAIKEDRDAA